MLLAGRAVVAASAAEIYLQLRRLQQPGPPMALIRDRLRVGWSPASRPRSVLRLGPAARRPGTPGGTSPQATVTSLGALRARSNPAGPARCPPRAAGWAAPPPAAATATSESDDGCGSSASLGGLSSAASLLEAAGASRYHHEHAARSLQLDELEAHLDEPKLAGMTGNRSCRGAPRRRSSLPAHRPHPGRAGPAGGRRPPARRGGVGAPLPPQPQLFFRPATPRKRRPSSSAHTTRAPATRRGHSGRRSSAPRAVGRSAVRNRRPTPPVESSGQDHYVGEP